MRQQDVECQPKRIFLGCVITHGAQWAITQPRKNLYGGPCTVLPQDLIRLRDKMGIIKTNPPPKVQSPRRPRTQTTDRLQRWPKWRARFGDISSGSLTQPITYFCSIGGRGLVFYLGGRGTKLPPSYTNQLHTEHVNVTLALCDM